MVSLLRRLIPPMCRRWSSARPHDRPQVPRNAILSLCLAALLIPRPAAAQITGQLDLFSDPGDYIGQGLEQHFTIGTANANVLDLTGDKLADFLTVVFFSPDGHFWIVSFGTNQLGSNLVPGTYTNAERASFASPGHPGLDVSGDGRGCNTVTGSFTIEDAVFDYSSGSPRLRSFKASFEQHCEGADPALRGSFSYLDQSDLSIPVTTASLDGPLGANDWYTGPVQVTLTATDADGPADIAATYYAVDSGAAQTYQGPFAISGDGFHTFSFWSVDRSGNQELQHYQFLKIDATAPSITEAAAMELLRTQKGYTALTTVSGKIGDALSGVDPASATFSVADELQLDQPSGPVTLQADGSYSFLVALDAPRSNKDKDGRTYVITIQAKDIAGNTGSQTVTLVVPRR